MNKRGPAWRGLFVRLGSAAANGNPSMFALPVLRRWEVPGRGLLDSSAQPGRSVFWQAEHFFAVDGNRIACRHIDQGKECWTQEMPFVAEWADMRDEVVIIAGRDGVQGRLRENGRLLWYFPSPAVVSQRVQCAMGNPYSCAMARVWRAFNWTAVS